jgi:hypothetical protein
VRVPELRFLVLTGAEQPVGEDVMRRHWLDAGRLCAKRMASEGWRLTVAASAETGCSFQPAGGVGPATI